MPVSLRGSAPGGSVPGETFEPGTHSLSLGFPIWTAGRIQATVANSLLHTLDA